MKSDFVIMCGGFGTRLKPFTYLIPKPFLTSNNISPFEYSLNNILKNGRPRKIFATVYYKSEYSKKKIKEKNKKIIIIKEKKPLGTAGSLRMVLNKIETENFVVINGDTFSKINFCKLIENHHKNKADLTVCVKDHQIKIPYAVVKKSNKNFIFKEKPVLKKKINTGIYVIKKKFLKKYFNFNKSDTVNMDKILNFSKKTKIFNIGNKWIDIGEVGDFKRAYEEIKNW